MKPLQGNRLKSAVLCRQSACGTKDLLYRQRKRLAMGLEATRGVLAGRAGQYRFAARERSSRKVTLACGGVIVCCLRRAADRGVEARALLGWPITRCGWASGETACSVSRQSGCMRAQAQTRYGYWRNGFHRPVLKHGPRSLTYARVFGWQTQEAE